MWWNFVNVYCEWYITHGCDIDCDMKGTWGWYITSGCDIDYDMENSLCTTLGYAYLLLFFFTEWERCFFFFLYLPYFI